MSEMVKGQALFFSSLSLFGIFCMEVGGSLFAWNCMEFW